MPDLQALLDQIDEAYEAVIEAAHNGNRFEIKAAEAIYAARSITSVRPLTHALRAVLHECDKAAETATIIFGGERLSGMVNTERLRQAITDAIGADHE